MFRSASPAQNDLEQRAFIKVNQNNPIGITGNKMKLAQTEATQKITAAIANAKKIKKHKGHKGSSFSRPV